MYDIIRQFPDLSKRKIKTILRSESSRLEVTKSLLDIVYNLVVVGSVPASTTQKEYLDQHSALVWQLLSKSKSLGWKKALLGNNIPLVVVIAASCPTVAGS